jgi:hypothetical protein
LQLASIAQTDPSPPEPELPLAPLLPELPLLVFVLPVELLQQPVKAIAQEAASNQPSGDTSRYIRPPGSCPRFSGVHGFMSRPRL